MEHVLIDAVDIKLMADKPWTDAQTKRADNLLFGIDGWIKRHAPCLVSGADMDAINEGREIVAEALLRAISAGTGNEANRSQSIGPDSTAVGYVDRAALPTLTAADKDRLKELCPQKRRRRRIGTIRLTPGH